MYKAKYWKIYWTNFFKIFFNFYARLASPAWLALALLSGGR